jgi:phospholipid/cholesterol/gamma-HCH transport system ATP-binding protein
MAIDQPQPVLCFENASLVLDDDPVLQDVSFTIREGETRVILGSAGSGKTVLLKTAVGLLRPTSGRVLLFGADITGLSERELYDMRARVGMLFQEGGLFDSLSVEENVAYPLLNQRLLRIPAEEARPRVEQALQFVELDQTMEKFPSELSGGMRRRVGIARALVTSPPLLLYDSPTAGLDPITACTIISLIIKGRDVRGATTVLVTHRYQDGTWLDDFRYNPRSGRLDPATSAGTSRRDGTRFMVMREGRLVFEGNRDELEACPDPYIAKFVKR